MKVDYVVTLDSTELVNELGLDAWHIVDVDRIINELKIRQLIPFDFTFLVLASTPEKTLLHGYIQR